MMSPSSFRIARDYNRGLPAPARWVHGALFPYRWSLVPARRIWAAPLLFAVTGVLLLIWFDPALIKLSRMMPEGGDIKRELNVLQQYGAFSSIVITCVLMLLLDRRSPVFKWGAVINLVAAILAMSLFVNILKMTIGRPRPRLDAPYTFLWPWGTHPLERGGEIVHRHAWEIWGDISSDLWSMPSSHTAAAAVLSLFLYRMYPQLRVFTIVMVAIVGTARVLFGAHYPTDVVVGAAAGYVIAAVVLNLNPGPRLLARREQPRA